MWSGLGITAGQPYGSWFEFNDATHEAISKPFLPYITKFPRIRAIRDRSSTTSKTANRLWLQDIHNHNPSTYRLYGTANNSSIYLPSLYSSYLAIMLDDAQWAQENGIDMFCVGNEFETNGQRKEATSHIVVSSLTRASNVVTAVTATDHNLQTGDTVDISGSTPSNFNATETAVTVVNSTTLTYASTGSDGSATGSLKLYAGVGTLQRLIKALAVEAQAVFDGIVIYSFSQGYESYYNTVFYTPGTDLDMIGYNVYGSSLEDFKSKVSATYAVHGTNVIITEFNLDHTWSSANVRGATVSHRNFDLAYADEAYIRLKYIQSVGIEQAYFFTAWNASASENNAFTVFYNTNTTTGNGGSLQGNFKAIYYRLLEERIGSVFFGTQQST
jgi:hypothetical protein